MTQEWSLMKTVHLAQGHDLHAQLVMKYFAQFVAHQVEKGKRNVLFLEYYCPYSSAYLQEGTAIVLEVKSCEDLNLNFVCL